MIIYRKDNKGNIRYLEVIASDDNIIQRSGIFGTENEIEHIKKAKPKNIGKSNETTAKQQAILEAESIIISKLKEGYFKTIQEAKNEIVILPMLAKNYNDEKHKIDWKECFIQPKLDGMRCLAHCDGKGVVKLISRDGRLIENMDHISDELSKNIKEDVILDGELYYHGLSFQENMKLIKKYRKGETENIKFHVYDRISTNGFKERTVREYIKNLHSCKEVSTYEVTNKDMMIKYHEIFLKEGYEGSIIRWGKEGYKINGRSSNLLKYKDFQDIDATIIDIIPAEQRPEWGVPVLKYSNQKLDGKNEITFKAGLKYSHKDREEFLKNKQNYIGKIANIRFFEYTDDGLPRFPVMFGIRGDCQKD
jgi:DNA ligase-1